MLGINLKLEFNFFKSCLAPALDASFRGDFLYHSRRSLRIHVWFVFSFERDRCQISCLDLNLGQHSGVLFLFDFLHLCLRKEPLGKCSQISRKEDTVRPASFFTPKTAELVAYSVVCGFCQATMFAFAEFVVPLRNLPD